jgi:tripartite-type tricarboxylate transporter receptor subunit TctC
MFADLRAIVAICTAVALLDAPANAADYPSKPIHLIVPLAAGGLADATARMLAQKLQQNMGQPVIIDNRPGGGFNIAMGAAAKAAPDGYHVLLGVSQMFVLNPFIYPALPFDADRDFALICLVATQNLIVYSSKQVAVKTLAELIALARHAPGKITFGAQAYSSRLIGELLTHYAGVDMVYVPYKGASELIQALLSGEITIAITTVEPYANYANEGSIMALASTGHTRERRLPNTPTFTELGFPQLELSDWIALAAPSRTPGPIIERLHAAVTHALDDPELQKRFKSVGSEPRAGGPAELAALISSGRVRWAKSIKEAGIELHP